MGAIYDIPKKDMDALLIREMEIMRRRAFEALVAYSEWYCFHDCKKECQGGETVIPYFLTKT